jgi:hypothetical protein
LPQREGMRALPPPQEAGASKDTGKPRKLLRRLPSVTEGKLVLVGAAPGVGGAP